MSGEAAIGAYRLLRRLSTTDEGSVWLALSQGPLGFERRVILKRRRVGESAKLLAREADACARIVHPAIVRLYDFFEHHGDLVLVREFVEGVTLEELLEALRARGERLPPSAALFVGMRIFSALAAAHAAKDPSTGELTAVIHRDVTPSNVLLPWDGFVRLADFGFAKVCGRAGDTASGVLKGTYGYMAPEQVRGEAITVRTDVYCASLVIREMLVGAPAFPRGDLPELEMLQSMAEPHLPAIEFLCPDVPLQLATAMRRALHPEADARAMTAELMQRVLREQIDPDEARGALIETMLRMRSSLPVVMAPLRSTPPRGIPMPAAALPVVALKSHATPGPVVAAVEGDQDEGFEGEDTTQSRGDARRFTLAIAFAAMFAIAATIAFWPAKKMDTKITATSMHVDLPKTTTQASPPPTIATTTMSEVKTVAMPTTGTIVTPPSVKSNRVFVDGKCVGQGGGAIVVACGDRAVKIGSAGKLQHVDVPCGGEALVQPKW
jgi:serine/threonine protein kinase